MLTAAVSVQVALGFLPVCAFLLALLYLDSYKLMRLRTVLDLLVAGCIAAGIGYAANQGLLRGMGMDRRILTRFAAPAIEEFLKALPILILLRRKRIGFLIDAAIAGFAVGTGFALAENVYYASALPDTEPAVWLVRGFGTALMHGGTTAAFSMLTKLLGDRRQSESWWLIAPGLAVAFTIHSLFNNFIVSPMLSTVAIVLVLPPLLVLIFSRGERHLQSWLGSGFDLDSELLKAIRSGDFAVSRTGQYLQSLRQHFDGAVLADMLCYLRLQSELSLRAKGILMMRENGFPVKKDVETAAKLAELRYLRHSIGRTGELAIAPIAHRSSHDIWQLQMLEE